MATYDPLPKRAELFAKGLLLRGLLALTRQHNLQGPIQLTAHSKVLCIRLHKIGDALVSTALLDQLKRQTGCTIHVLASPGNQFIFRAHPLVDTVHVFAKGLGYLARFRSFTRRQAYDVVIDLHDHVSTTVTYLVALAAAPVKLGLGRGNEQVYTHTVPRPPIDLVHIIDREMALLQPLGLTPLPPVNVVYPLTAQGQAKAQAFIAAHFGVEPRRRRVLVNISAGAQARFWGVPRFQALLAYLDELGLQSILSCPPAELATAQAVDARRPCYAVPSFQDFAALVPLVDLIFTPDTSLIHLASAYHVPVFGLYACYTPAHLPWTSYASAHAEYLEPNPTLATTTAEQVIPLLAQFMASMWPEETPPV